MKHRLADAERAEAYQSVAAAGRTAVNHSSMYPSRVRISPGAAGPSRSSLERNSSNAFQTGGMSIWPATQVAHSYASQPVSVQVGGDRPNPRIQMGYAEQSHLDRSSSSAWNLDETGLGGRGGEGVVVVGAPTSSPSWSTVASPALSSATTTTTTTSRTSGSGGSHAGHSIMPLTTTDRTLDGVSQLDWTTMTGPS